MPRSPIPQEPTLTPEQHKRMLAAKLLLARAEASRVDPVAHFAFVMKTENTGAALQALPHQRLTIQFIQRNRWCVVMMPPGGSKTFCTVNQSLYWLGQDRSARGVYMGKTEAVASKPLMMTKNYIEESLELRLAFSQLKPSKRSSEPWTNSQITVDRPMGIKDPSIAAIGLGTTAVGSRLNFAIVDDIHDQLNTINKEQMDKTYDSVSAVVMKRLDPQSGRLVVVNTAWHEEDTPHRLMRSGTPTLCVELDGDVYMSGVPRDHWKQYGLRPKHGKGIDQTPRVGELGDLKEYGPFRLVDNDALAPTEQAAEALSFWPGKFTPEHIQEVKLNTLPHRLTQLYYQRTYSDLSARCQRAWIEACKEAGVRERHYRTVDEYSGPNPVVIGVDLAYSEDKQNDNNVFAAFEFIPRRPKGFIARLLNIKSFQAPGPMIARELLEWLRRYNASAVVEDNAAQTYLIQFMREMDFNARIYPHRTGDNKWDPQLGVESVFLTFMQGAFIIPCDLARRCEANVQRFLDGCMFYRPTRHTPDELMAVWFSITKGRELAAYAALAQGTGPGLGNGMDR